MKKTELKKRRERLGLTQAGLAEILGITSNTVSRYESDKLDIPKWMDLVLEALEARQIKELQSPVNG